MKGKGLGSCFHKKTGNFTDAGECLSRDSQHDKKQKIATNKKMYAYLSHYCVGDNQYL